MKRVILAGVAGLAACGLSACHVYVPTELSAVPAGEEVRVYFTRNAAAALPEEVPVNDALFLGGRLVQQQPDSVVLGIRMAQPAPGMLGQDLRQMVRIESGQIVDVRRREFSTPRTALIVGGGVLAVSLIVGMIFGAERSVDYGDPDEDLSRVPALRVPFGLLVTGP